MDVELASAGSPRETHGFTLSRPAAVDVALTDLTLDVLCTVNGASCMDGAGTDSAFWSGELEAGDHEVVVERDSPAAGGYSLTVTATETMAAVAAPLAGGPAFVVVARICVVKEYGDTTEKTCHHTFFYTLFDVTNVTGNDTGPPPGAGPGEGPEGPDDGGDGGGEGLVTVAVEGVERPRCRTRMPTTTTSWMTGRSSSRKMSAP